MAKELSSTALVGRRNGKGRGSGWQHERGSIGASGAAWAARAGGARRIWERGSEPGATGFVSSGGRVGEKGGGKNSRLSHRYPPLNQYSHTPPDIKDPIPIPTVPLGSQNIYLHAY